MASSKPFPGKRVNVSLTRTQEVKLRLLRRTMNLESDAATVRRAIEYLHALHKHKVIDLAMMEFESALTLEKKSCQKENTEEPVDTVENWLYPNRE